MLVVAQLSFCRYPLGALVLSRMPSLGGLLGGIIRVLGGVLCGYVAFVHGGRVLTVGVLKQRAFSQSTIVHVSDFDRAPCIEPGWEEFTV